ncbi:hypothetical protein AB0383_03780 [Amycolatopsis sp. NPDC051373]
MTSAVVLTAVAGCGAAGDGEAQAAAQKFVTAASTGADACALLAPRA